MGTSRSSDPEGCTATVWIYSGRPDPQWNLPAAVTQRLWEIWQKLDPLDKMPPPAPALGYRGSILDCGKRGRWQAYRGAVISGESRRSDPGRAFERLLLDSAPKDLIPADVLREVLRQV